MVQNDHLKHCMTTTGYNQVMVMVDLFIKHPAAVPCMTASAEETCDRLINVLIARQGRPIMLQSDNGKAFVCELTKGFTKRSERKSLKKKQTEIEKVVKPDFPLTKGKRQSKKRGSHNKK